MENQPTKVVDYTYFIFIFNAPIHVAYTPCLGKIVPVLFENNSAKQCPTLFIFGKQHREKNVPASP